MALGRAGDPLVKAQNDYRELIAAVGKHHISELSFHLPGLGRAFMAALDQRSSLDGERADVRLVHARLIRDADAEGAHHAYGIDVYQHLERWAEAAPPAVNADFYAWAVARHARARVVDEALATAHGDRAAGVDPAVVARRLSAALAGTHAPGRDDKAGTGLTRAEEEAFWTARPELAHVHRAARSLRAAPWAVLANVLLQIMARVSPTYVIGPVGAEVSLNLYYAAVGPSGAGKNRAEKVARAVIRFVVMTAEGWVAEPADAVPEIPVGTGEGIYANYVRHGVNPATEQVELYQHTVSSITTVSEVDKLAAIKGRQGATIMANLRDGWTGEKLGNGNAGPEYRLIVMPHAYRLGVVVGVQPARGRVLLNEDEIAGGTPQRFGWFPVTDPDAPRDRRDKPSFPGRLDWAMPAWPDGPEHPFVPGWHVIPMCAEAEDAADANAVARLAGEETDPIDSHAVLNRLKWAASLGLFNGHVGIDEQDWRLSGILMKVSDRTRQGIIDALRDATETANRGKGVAEGRRAVIVEDMKDAAAIKSVCAAVLRKVGRATGDGWVSGNQLTQTVAPKNKPYIGPAVERLVGTGQIEHEEVNYRGNPGYRVRAKAARLQP